MEQSCVIPRIAHDIRNATRCMAVWSAPCCEATTRLMCDARCHFVLHEYRPARTHAPCNPGYSGRWPGPAHGRTRGPTHGPSVVDNLTARRKRGHKDTRQNLIVVDLWIFRAVDGQDRAMNRPGRLSEVENTVGQSIAQRCCPARRRYPSRCEDSCHPQSVPVAPHRSEPAVSCSCASY